MVILSQQYTGSRTVDGIEYIEITYDIFDIAELFSKLNLPKIPILELIARILPEMGIGAYLPLILLAGVPLRGGYVPQECLYFLYADIVGGNVVPSVVGYTTLSIKAYYTKYRPDGTVTLLPFADDIEDYEYSHTLENGLDVMLPGGGIGGTAGMLAFAEVYTNTNYHPFQFSFLPGFLWLWAGYQYTPEGFHFLAHIKELYPYVRPSNGILYYVMYGDYYSIYEDDGHGFAFPPYVTTEQDFTGHKYHWIPWYKFPDTLPPKLVWSPVVEEVFPYTGFNPFLIEPKLDVAPFFRGNRKPLFAGEAPSLGSFKPFIVDGGTLVIEDRLLYLYG